MVQAISCILFLLFLCNGWNSSSIAFASHWYSLQRLLNDQPFLLERKPLGSRVVTDVASGVTGVFLLRLLTKLYCGIVHIR